jgi:hypothetical protein
MTEIRIGGTDNIDIMAREWSEDEPIDIFIHERLRRTEQGDLFFKLLVAAAPQNIGTCTPEDVARYCEQLARHAYAVLEASEGFAVAEPSQKVLRRKIDKHKEKVNGDRS